ncbi:DUF2798 domain-containing protein [Rhizobium sp. SG_E_25_P2]|uniref:DUF2798 domain-containing protein n=1 Tax=Rhizobium sp. SG_E_25_P2 TaxID=2879942 RepID=UPI0024769838|nr:DUF2798 domain-containing protein [Rhizobium sp. SG_E_25_P2]
MIMKFTRLPARYAGLLLPLVLSLLMTFVVSGVSTLKVIGLSADLLSHWMSAWGVSWLIAFPTLLVAMPAARRVVRAVTEPV